MKKTRWIVALLCFASGLAFAERWVKCADEGNTCRFADARRVGYGVDNKWAYRTFENQVACTSAAFGTDPLPGKRKRCRYLVAPAPTNVIPAAPGWAVCAKEGGVCQVNGKKKVAFGYGGNWVTETFIGGIDCTNGVFGDPAPGKVKECRVQK